MAVIPIVFLSTYMTIPWANCIFSASLNTAKCYKTCFKIEGDAFSLFIIKMDQICKIAVMLYENIIRLYFGKLSEIYWNFFINSLSCYLTQWLTVNYSIIRSQCVQFSQRICSNLFPTLQKESQIYPGIILLYRTYRYLQLKKKFWLWKDRKKKSSSSNQMT